MGHSVEQPKKTIALCGEQFRRRAPRATSRTILWIVLHLSSFPLRRVQMTFAPLCCRSSDIAPLALKSLPKWVATQFSAFGT